MAGSTEVLGQMTLSGNGVHKCLRRRVLCKLNAFSLFFDFLIRTECVGRWTSSSLKVFVKSMVDGKNAHSHSLSDSKYFFIVYYS
jgi:hypothetical protein